MVEGINPLYPYAPELAGLFSLTARYTSGESDWESLLSESSEEEEEEEATPNSISSRESEAER